MHNSVHNSYFMTEFYSTMKKKKFANALILCCLVVQSQAQHNNEHASDRFVKKDLSDYSEHVASKTNPDYFDQHDHDSWTYFLNKTHPSVSTLEQYFDEAAQEYGVPATLLKAIGRVESNWTQIGPSIDRGWGIMHLVDNDYVNTLSEASILTGIAEDMLKDDPQSNIRGAAALLAQYAGPEVIGKSDLSLWFEASIKFSALALEELKISQAELYYSMIKSGDTSQTVWGETIRLKAHKTLAVPQLKASTRAVKKSVSADYTPAISFITPCNFGTGRNHVIDTWVNHWIGVGSYAGAISWFHTCRPNSPSSAHFVIRSSDGEITQVVRVSNTAYHAGASGQPYNNSRSIGVEHEATATEPGLWNSEPMLNASTTMACYFTGIHAIPQSRGLPGIREHNEMPGTSTDCAGSIPWSTWMNKFTTCVNGGSLSMLDCSTAVTIDCGVTYSGSASTSQSNVDSYACNTWTETGPERVHKVTSLGYGTLTASLSNYTGDLDVYILKSCDPNDCVGTVSSDQATFTNAIAGQVYYIVVDADDGSGSAYDLIVSCPTGGSGSGLDCTNAIPLQCGVSYTGSSSTAVSAVDSYSCNTWTETGPERLHTVTPSASGELTASLFNYTGDLDVYILNSCDPDDCIGTVSSDSATYPNAIAGQTYYIVVDADDGSGSGYDLLVDCVQDGLACSSAVAVQCGVSYSGSSSTSPSYVDAYGCNNWTETGPERLHTVIPTASGELTASLSNYTGDLDVYILNSCDPDDCIGTVSSDSATYPNAIAGQTYYIVVDADDGSGSGYDLLVDCVQDGLACSSAVVLQCGVSYSGSSSTNPSYVDTYGCNTWTETGPERLHTVIPTASGELTASLSNYTGDLDVYILNSCDPDDCIGTVSSDSATYPSAVAGQTYYIVVDADDGSGSGYDLIVICESTDCETQMQVSGSYQQDETFQAEQEISSNATFSNSSTIIMHAGQTVELTGGFTIDGGTAIHIYIEGCQ